jgi:hypothetical protein
MLSVFVPNGFLGAEVFLRTIILSGFTAISEALATQ